MSVGDISNPKRVRIQANERLDTLDADALSVAAREHLDAYARAIDVLPHNVGSSTPVGFIFQGFGLTLNPTGASDSKVRIQSPVGVAFDANGRMLIKENGVTADLTLPAGNSQIYAYYVEDNSDTSVRRVISVTAPFTESGPSISTKLKSDIAFYTRAGDATSIVASDVVNGATTALCFLGVVTNTAGVVTTPGSPAYDPVNAPNGAAVTNRLTTIAAPTTLPPASTAGGSVATMHGLASAVAYMVGQAMWKGSTSFTPNAANNFGAFTTPPAGIGGLFNSLGESTVTPITTWQSWNQKVRSVVDHNGYRMGQVSEIDTVWETGGFNTGVTNFLPLTALLPAIGAWTYNGSAWNAPGGAGTFTVYMSLDSLIPIGASVSALFVSVIRGTSSDTTTITLQTQDGLGVSSFVLTNNLTTGTGQHFVDVLQGASHSPIIMSSGMQLQIATVQTTSTAIVGFGYVASTLPPGWVAVTSTSNLTSSVVGDSITTVGAQSQLNQAGVTLSSTSVGGIAGLAHLFTSSNEVFFDANCAFVMETMVLTGVITDASNHRSFMIGLTTGSPPSSVFLYSDNTFTNWQLRTAVPAVVNVDTGVAIAANTLYRVRWEMYGANVNSSGSVKIRLYINGNKVAETNVAFPTTTLRPSFTCSTNGVAGGPYSFTIGRLRRVWNHLLNGDNL